MGSDKRYPYPKYVWSPAGGWWCEPRNWKRNSAIALAFTFAISIPVVWLDFQTRRSYHPPIRPSFLQKFAKHAKEDDPRLA